MSASAQLPAYRLFVGVDISATTATVAWMPLHGPVTRAITIDQTAAGFAALQQQVLATGHPAASILVVMEATGTYWITLATTLAAAGFSVSVVNPAQAHAFAQALLKRVKTDAIDAQTLAHLAARLQPAPWTPPPAVYVEVQQRLTQRDALVTLRTQVQNQLHALIQQPVVITTVRTRMEQLVSTLTEQINAVEREIAEALRQDVVWAESAARLQTISGIGLLTAAWLLVTTLNFTLCHTPEEATAYAGLAPNQWQSGTSIRGRPTIGHTGNRRLRRALYLATLSATQHNPPVAEFYQRLRAAGKPPRVARCAAARKLLHIAWAVVPKGQVFDPNYHATHQHVING